MVNTARPAEVLRRVNPAARASIIPVLPSTLGLPQSRSRAGRDEWWQAAHVLEAETKHREHVSAVMRPAWQTAEAQALT
ncbi:hypothetical protein F442_15515 [Phytophthora nicotianae P10297]|nr:hypothetical protein PPTG_21450 [Phytophthora nicotianae INRA-310]ETN19360.1 hypothetical protein PPTG_21450 [Phytophthora nicotianae INRA-310]ETP36589.1 hypothetical protein F442_15515 [Phytophthora nicotianae P10297]